MTPRIFRLVLWFFAILPGIGVANALQPDSLSILHKDSVAYRIFLSNPDSAIRIAHDALSEAQLVKSKYLQGLTNYILSKAYWTKANYKLSAEYGFKALRAFENSGQTDLWAKSLLSLARTFIDLGNNKQGRIFINKAILLSKTTNNAYILAEAYREKTMLLSQQKSYDSALYYCDLGIALFDIFKDSVSQSILFSRKGKIYFALNQYSKSSFYNRKALQYDSLVGNKRALGISYYQSALDAVHLNHFDTAITLLQKSIPINEDMHNMTSLIRVHTLLSEIYAEQKMPGMALAEMKKVTQYKDSLYNAEKSGQLQEMQSLYELASKEQQIEMLEKDNKVQQQEVKIQRLVTGFLLVGMIFLGLTIYFLQRYRKLQDRSHAELENKNRSIEQQKEEIQSQAETLHHLNRLKSKLFSVISHDLRGPMATLHALLDLLTKKKMTPEEFISVSEKLKASMDVTQRTMENLLNWSMSQMEGIKAEPKILDVKHTISEACNLMDEAAQKKNVVIENRVESALMVAADADQLQLILRNLIHNAIKFSKPYDNVSVSAYKNTNYCHISVKDSGIGMSKSEIETIVSSRHHFSKTGTMQEKGTGLGLLLCQEFIKMNGGDISIKSNINQGTEVVFTLPLA
jgi:two-component system sensor histidine kinase/response regulator